MKTAKTASSGRTGAVPVEPASQSSALRKRLSHLPCVFCGRNIEMTREGRPAGPDAFAVCREDDAKLDAAIAALTAEVLALLEDREANSSQDGGVSAVPPRARSLARRVSDEGATHRLPEGTRREPAPPGAPPPT